LKQKRISDDVVVKGATFENGLLNVELERIIPEEKKPRLIEIK
jgi:molecular chaperone IbpA